MSQILMNDRMMANLAKSLEIVKNDGKVQVQFAKELVLSLHDGGFNHRLATCNKMMSNDGEFQKDLPRYRI